MHRKRHFFVFYSVGIGCGLLSMAVLVQIFLALRTGTAAAHVARGRTGTVLVNASAVDDPSAFWFFIGAWGLGAILLLYLAVRFIRLARTVKANPE